MTYCATQEKRHIQAAGPSQQVPLACMCVSARLCVCVFVCVLPRSPEFQSTACKMFFAGRERKECFLLRGSISAQLEPNRKRHRRAVRS